MFEQEWEQRKERGFTLVELLVAIVVVGVLAAVAIVGINSLVNKGENAACSTASAWPSSLNNNSPVAAFHSRDVLSPLAVMMRWPSGENAACSTALVWPSRLANSSPVAAFHTRAVLSSLAVTMRWPSGENAA